MSILLEGVTKRFPGAERPAVDDVSFEVRQGETLALLGSSGCGKTTTLKMINRLLEPSAGRIVVDGSDTATIDLVQLRRSIGYVFQGVGLFPHFRVWENITVALRVAGRPAAERRERAIELLEMVSLGADFVDRLPAELSGGQQQRVGVARALAADPSYLLMDEPFGALDAVTRDSLHQELIQLRKRIQVTIVFVTHDIFEALKLADRVGVMHDGLLDQLDTPAELTRAPATDFVRDLFEHPRRQLATLNSLSEQTA